ncbi:mediator of DNA damage checkpoint protein 1-like [Amphibalanus amphitrite]|uniref:mediator of DNA damage checkpoint protein 1-like n=1 Tax=Amphibalanus amphitrite TaxID=1232801 RepID=UPI001C91CC1B|nr:mediator of DNA damage checkpoint protein 1-like [Amphibalanus amphitrite]
MKDERVPLKTILQNFINHVENLEAKLKGNDDLYESEFQELKNISDSLKSQKYYACTEGEKSFNRRKNRYKDILPFDVSRVVLSEFPGVAGSDYINANYIRGASGSPAYIASQGPLPHTVADFWRMAVECEVQVIVMACNQTEAGKHKCELYVPEQKDVEQLFGDVGVTLSQSRQICPDFTVKKLTVRYTGSGGTREERLVCQFHYSAWPDHGVPSSVVPLLQMIRMLRDTQASETLPVLVHCSAGCGRTGTICAIDYVWGLLKAGKLTPTFSLFDLVAEMRRQRIAMVQTKDQYMLVHRAVRQLFADQLRVIESHPYANVDSAGKVLAASAAADSGDYEEICLAVEAPPPVQDPPTPSPPPRHRKSTPRQRCRPPPLPQKRKAPQPEPEPPSAAVRPSAEPEYQGSLDRAETGRRAGVGRLRQLFETTESEPAAPRPRLARSKSSAALRYRAPGPSDSRTRTNSVSIPRDRQLVPYTPPSNPPTGPSETTYNRARSPSQSRKVSHAKSPVQVQLQPDAVKAPGQVPAAAARARSPLQARPPVRARTSPLPGVTVNNVATAPPVVRVVGRTYSPSSRLADRRSSPHDRRPALPIKRSKSLKMPVAPLRTQRLGPAYLALENSPSLHPPPAPAAPVVTPIRTPSNSAALSTPLQPLHVNVTRPSVGPGTSASDSPPRYVNIELLRQYEAELVERSRQLGLNDTLTEDTSPIGPVLAAGPVSPAVGGDSDLVGEGPRYANVLSQSLPPQPPPPAEEPAPTSNYPNCRPEVHQNLSRIESDLQRNPRSGFYDASGESSTTSQPPPVSSLGWHARERRNSFRQAVESGDKGRSNNYEPIWVNEGQHSPLTESLEQQRQRQPRGTSTPRGVESANGVPPMPHFSPRSAAADPGRPAVVPVSSYIVQGGGSDTADSPLLVGNSLFWPDALGWRGETDGPVSLQPRRDAANNVIAHGDPPNTPGRSTSLSVSENSAFKPYLANKPPSLNYNAAYRKANNDCSPSPGGREPHPDQLVTNNSSDHRPVAPPRKRTSGGALSNRLSLSQPLLVGPSHLFVADGAALRGVGGPDRRCSGEEADSDTDSVPPAVPEKTQAAYEVPTPVRDVIQPVRQRHSEPPPPPPPPPLPPALPLEAAGVGAVLPQRPGDRAESTEARPLNRALGRLQASLRSRLGGRTEQQPAPPRGRTSPAAQVNAHSRQAYI